MLYILKDPIETVIECQGGWGLNLCGHKYFSTEKSRDPASARRPPACTKYQIKYF